MSVPFSTRQFSGDDSPFPIRKIPIDAIRPSQAVLDERKVERMRKTWSADMAEPVVAERNGEFTVLDGHHRWAAAKARGHKYLRARISS